MASCATSGGVCYLGDVTVGERPLTKRALRRAAFAAVAVLFLAGLPAYAQDPSESAVPSSSEVPSAPVETPAPPAKEPEKQPEKPAEQAAQPDLKISVSVPPGDQVVAEEFPVTVTIENKGDADATAVTGDSRTVSGTPLFVSSFDWKEFRPGGSGGTIAPGKSVTLKLNSRFDDFKGGDAAVSFSVQTQNDANPEDNAQQVAIPIVPPSKTSTVGGHLYGDKNDNGKFDAGEGLAGITLNLRSTGGPDSPQFETKTTADGRFDIRDVPARRYYLSYPYELPGGWIGEGQYTVRADGTDANAEIRLAAVKPLRETVKVSAKFLEGPYKPGDRANVAITLANTGTKTVERLVAGCDRGGFPERHLGGWTDPAQWGDLAYDVGQGKGVTLKPGETTTVQVSGLVPAGSAEDGVVYIACDFGPVDQRYISGYPDVFVLAKVPGKSADSSGAFFHDRNDNWTIDEGEAIGDLEVVLTDPLDGSEVGKAKTQADGSIKFGTLPVGWYVPVFHGPWKLRDQGFVVVSTNPFWSEDWQVRLVPGQASQPPDTKPNAPIPTKKVENKALAKTGADVTGLAIGGFAVLVVGVGVVLFARKRRRQV